MNFSRYTYFDSLVSIVVRRCAEQKRMHFWFDQEPLQPFLVRVVEEINFQVQSIYSKQKGGYWPVTDGDRMFIKFMERAARFIYALLAGDRITLIGLRLLTSQLAALLDEAKNNNNPRVKAVFLLQETVGWPSFESVYEAFQADPLCEAQLVYLPFEHVNNDATRSWFAEYQALGLPVIQAADYNLAKESPDIAFFSKPYDCIPMQFYIDNVDRVVQRSVYVPYFVNWMASQNISFLINYHFQLPLQYKAWKIFDAPNYVRDLHTRYGYRNGENIVIGHPRFDGANKLAILRESIPSSWRSKIDGRKVFMWNTHVPMGDGTEKLNDWSTFALFGRDLLSYFKTHPEIVLLWRPHPSFFQGLINQGFFSAEEVEAIKSEVNSCENMILDLTNDYRLGFSVADAFISDASSLLVEFFMTGKPILYTYQANTFAIVHPALLPAYSIAETWLEIQRFITMVVEERDDKTGLRAEVIREIGIIPQANIGMMVKEICIQNVKCEESLSAAVWLPGVQLVACSGQAGSD